MLIKFKKEKTNEIGTKIYRIYWRKDKRFNWTSFRINIERFKGTYKAILGMTYIPFPREFFICVENILRGLNSNG